MNYFYYYDSFLFQLNLIYIFYLIVSLLIIVKFNPIFIQLKHFFYSFTLIFSHTCCLIIKLFYLRFLE